MPSDLTNIQPELKLYNTLTRSKTIFSPIDPANVRIYACGPTVYDLAHIGNSRPIIVFDLLFRLLRQLYGNEHVTYVRNITDVDDKINKKAFERGITIRQLTEETAAQFHADIRELNVLMPEDVNIEGSSPRFIEPRATDHINEMHDLINRLVENGHAYVAEEHVLFHVPSMADYGSLSRRPLDEMESGARVDVAPYKKSPLDFVLWKPSSSEDPSWNSPAGIKTPGRPGWHIECSAMSWRYLGETFDIHAGGIDLVFPHHENEIAQSRCCFNSQIMANYWLHNGFLQVEGQKMSKSLNNFKVIREELEQWPGEVMRLNMLRSHYRQPIDWSQKGLEESKKVLDRWYSIASEKKSHSPRFSGLILEALLDDLNTPQAIAALHKLENSKKWDDLASNLQALGFLKSSQEDWQKQKHSAPDVDIETVKNMIDQRSLARKNKNWAESDRIREELSGMGIKIEDNKDGSTSWEIA